MKWKAWRVLSALIFLVGRLIIGIGSVTIARCFSVAGVIDGTECITATGSSSVFKGSVKCLELCRHPSLRILDDLFCGLLGLVDRFDRDGRIMQETLYLVLCKVGRDGG